MVLVFSQQPGEQRKSERDEWIKKLMKLIVSERQEKSSTISPPADDQKTGIMPSMRRTFAPEMSLPFKTAHDTHPTHTEMIIMPDEPENQVFSEGAEPEIIPAPQTTGGIPVGSEEITLSADIRQPSTPDTEIPLISAEQVTLSEDAPQSEGISNGIIAVASEEGALSSGELKPPVQVNEEIQEHHEQVVLTPDELQLPVVQINEDIPEQVVLTPDELQPPVFQVNEEIPEHHEQVAHSFEELQPPVQDIEGIPEATEDTIELAELITPMEVQDDEPWQLPTKRMQDRYLFL